MEVIIVAWTSKFHKLTTFKVQTKKVACGKKKMLYFVFSIIQITKLPANSNVIFLKNVLLLTRRIFY